MTLEVKKRKRVRDESKIRWWKVTEQDCCVKIMEEVNEVLGVREDVLDSWGNYFRSNEAAVNKASGVTSGQRKEDTETWWWNDEVQESIRSKRTEKKME